MSSTNPPAFPHSHLGINHGQLSYEDSSYEDGMELRDYFAAAAIRGVVAAKWFNSEHTKMVVTQAYVIADAMLKAREEK